MKKLAMTPELTAVLCEFLTEDNLEVSARLMEDSIDMLVGDGVPDDASQVVDLVGAYRRMSKQIQNLLKYTREE